MNDIKANCLNIFLGNFKCFTLDIQGILLLIEYILNGHL